MIDFMVNIVSVIFWWLMSPPCCLLIEFPSHMKGKQSRASQYLKAGMQYLPWWMNGSKVILRIANKSSRGGLEAEIVETTFVRSRFPDIQHGYDFVPSRVQKKRPETTVVKCQNCNKIFTNNTNNHYKSVHLRLLMNKLLTYLLT